MGDPPRVPPLAEPGERIAHYEILEELGRGGMGVVYRARDLTLGRRVALKCPLPAGEDDPKQRKRLLREARAAARLSHPHIVPIYEVLEHGGVPWLAMELVDGTTLRGLLASGRPLPLKEVLRYAEGLASALETAHDGNVLHRDINPNNIIVTSDGRAVLTDFGLARFLGVSEGSSTRSRDSDLDGLGRAAGTPRYMSPEQALGKPLDARTDLFAIGAVIYEMCTGEPAFPGTGREVLDAILHRSPTPISRLNYDAPEELERIVRKCLAKDLEDRYQSARELTVDLRALRRRLEHDEYEETPPPRWRPLSGRPGRHWLGSAVVLAVVVALLGARYWETVHGAPPRPIPASAAHTLAVVPFENATGDPGWAHLVEGVTDDLTRALQKSGVVVKSRESAGQLRGLSDAEIARRLGVDRVGRGRISLEDGNILLEARLAQASTGSEVWSRTYRQPLDRLSGLYATVASDIAATTQPAPRRATASPYGAGFKAYEAYHGGRVYAEQRTRDSLLTSIEYFKRAAQLDPGYAQPWAGMADAYLELGVPAFGTFHPQEARRLANEAALKALDLDPNLAEAHVSLAWQSFFYDWDWTASEARFKRAIQLDPQYATAHHWYANYLNAMGRPAEAIQEIRKAGELEPLSILIHRDFAWHYFFQRRYADAVAQLENTLKMDPRYTAARSLLGRALIEDGRPADGLAELRKAALDMPKSAASAFIAYGEAVAGDKAAAERSLARALAPPDQGYVSPYYIALVYVRLGRVSEALDWLEKGFAEQDTTMVSLNIDPRFDRLRREPRFEALVRKMNFPGGGNSPRGIERSL